MINQYFLWDYKIALFFFILQYFWWHQPWSDIWLYPSRMMQPVWTLQTLWCSWTETARANVKISPSHLRVLEERVLLHAFNEHKSVGAVSGPVQQVLNQVLMVFKDSLWRTAEIHNEKERKRIIRISSMINVNKPDYIKILIMQQRFPLRVFGANVREIALV